MAPTKSVCLDRTPCRLVPDAHDPHTWTFDPFEVVAIGAWGTIPHSTIAALTALDLSVAAANAALGAALESIAHDNMLISRLSLRHETLVTNTLAWRLTKHHPLLPRVRRLAYIAVLCRVAVSTHILARRQHQRPR